MPRITRSAVVAAPLPVVFTALTEPDSRAQWLTSMIESGAAGPLVLGTRIPARRSDPKSRSQYELVVSALEPNARIELDVVRNGAPAGKGGYTLTPAGDATRVAAFAEYELKGAQRLLGPVVAVGLGKGVDDDLAALKRFVERA